LVALGCFGWAVWHRDRSPAPRAVAKLAAGAVFMFALPEIVLAGASAHVTQSTEVLVFMLVPAVVVFWLGQQSAAFGADGGSLRGLVPALSGLGGAALILPFSLPSSWMGRLWLAALVVSAIAGEDLTGTRGQRRLRCELSSYRQLRRNRLAWPAGIQLFRPGM
jgi:hypothetical protein